MCRRFNSWRFCGKCARRSLKTSAVAVSRHLLGLLLIQGGYETHRRRRQPFMRRVSCSMAMPVLPMRHGPATGGLRPWNLWRMTLLWVYECKDHSGSIPVGRVEEFKAKLDQISSANRKGVFVATGELQDGALKYAQAHGIAVLHMPPEGPVVQVCHIHHDPRETVSLRLQCIAYQCQPAEARSARSSDLWRLQRPDGCVPVLAENDQTIVDSWAIVDHLERVHPDRPTLFSGPEEYAMVRLFDAFFKRHTPRSPCQSANAWAAVV